MPVPAARSSSSMNALPQSISVTSSPFEITAASEASSQMRGVRNDFFVPSAGFFLCRGTSTTSVPATPSSDTSTLPRDRTATCLGASGSITALLSAHSLSNSCSVTFFDAPCDRIKSRRAFTVRPRRTTPRTVGKRASSHPLTLPVCTNQSSLRLDMTVPAKARRE